MSNKTLTAAAALLLLAGVTAIAVPKLTKDKNAPASASASATTGITATGADARGTASRGKAKANPANARLSEKYGDARTKLSSHLGTELIGMLEDTVTVMELAHRMDLGPGMADDPENALGKAGKDIVLTPEQKEKIAALQVASFKRQSDEVRNLVASMRKDPAKIMESLLLSDSAKRGEITREEYEAEDKRLAIPKDDLKRALAGPENDDVPDDPVFLEEVLRVLNEEQTKAYQEALAARKAVDPATATKAEEDLLTLEELEKQIGSNRQIIRGALQMMEGITGGGLQR